MKTAVGAIRLFQALSRPGWRGRATAAFLGGVLALVRPRAARIDANLRLVHPDWDAGRRRQLRRELYRGLAWTVTETLALQQDPAQALDWFTEVEGQDVVEAALGGGAIFVTCHLGNWELFGSWYAQTLQRRGRPFYAVYQEIHDPDISRLLTEFRERNGIRTLPKEASTLDLVRLLRGGAHIAILEDVSWSGGALLPFMGHPCTHSLGPAVLAMLGGVPLIPAGSYRLAPFRHRARFLSPIFVPGDGPRPERLERATLAVIHALEDLIAPRPELWFWLHNRWKLGKKDLARLADRLAREPG